MNYKMTIGSDTESKIRAAFFDVGESLDPFGVFDESRIEAVEYQYRGGFIPFTNGGLNMMVVTTLAAIDEDLACLVASVRDPLEKVIAQCYADALEMFKDANKAALVGIDAEKLNYHDLNNAGFSDLAEDLSNYEHQELNEGGACWYVLRAVYYDTANSRNESGQPEIFFYAGFNTDFEYGRDRGLIDTFRKTITMEELDLARLPSLLNTMENSFLIQQKGSTL